MDNKSLLNELLRTEDENLVDEILQRYGLGLEKAELWRPLGDIPNNRSVVTNQQTEATAAFVEKITNGIDAVLLAECLVRRIDPKGPKAPATMTQAVSQFFDVRDGLIANLDPRRERTELAKNIHIVAVGEKGSPCYLIVDNGEGQSPDDFPNTFLSLIRDNKVGIPFVHGKFNCGGTGVLPFCGKQKIQLILSRRHPALVRKQDQSGQLWGFTVVRRLKPSSTRPSSMYVYLAPDGKVPRFKADAVDVLPEDRNTTLPRPYAAGIRYGTCVKLYNYEWKARSMATTEARYELERFLHSPCLPFRITETRKYTANFFSTTVSGVWASIDSEEVPEDSKVEEDFLRAFGELNLKEIGILSYRLTVYKESVNVRHVPHGVFFSLNGQVHGSLPSDFITDQLKFDYLKRHLLVSIDCTNMDLSVREEFFMPSRDRVRKNEVYDEIHKQLVEALKNHPGLRQLNSERHKRAIEHSLSNEEETKNLFNELLKADPMLARLFGSGDRLFTKTGPGPSIPFVGKKFPTYFRLTKNPTDGLTKSCPINLTCRVEFETDALNDYFKRNDSPGSIVVDPPDIFEQTHLWNGRFNASVRVPWKTKPGDQVNVTVTVSDVQTQMKDAPFVSHFTLVAESEQDPRPGGGNGHGPHGKLGDRSSAPTLTIPKLKWKSFDEQNIALRISHDADGELEYFANEKNKYFTDAIVRAKEEEHALIRFWFGHGLLLCALGMIKEQQERGEPDSGDDDSIEEADSSRETGPLERVGFYCDGIARIIIPMIRTLYRGPQR